MIKSEIRSLIVNLLPKLDKTGKYHPRFIDAAIEKVINEMYNNVYKRNPLELMRYTEGYGYTTALPVLSEASTGIYYTTLPSAIVPFPDKASGVRRVSTMVQGGMKFFPIDKREIELLLDNSNVNYVTSKIGYLVTPDRVEFYNLSGAVLGAGVRMDLIIPFSSYSDTDVVLLPEEVDPQGQTFVDKVLKTLSVIQPMDAVDNNADIKQTGNGQ